MKLEEQESKGDLPPLHLAETGKKNMETQSDKVKCLECGKYFKKLGGGHLEKIHNMSVADYKRKHPGARTASRSFIEKQKEDKRRQYAGIHGCSK